MRNLTIVRSNNCNPDVRVAKYLRILAKENFEVTFWGWRRDGVFNPLELNGIKNISLFPLRARYGAGIWNIFHLASFAIWVFLKVLFARSGRRTYHLCDFDTAFPAYLAIRLRKFFGRTDVYIYDIFDFYLDAFPVPKILQKLILRFEKKIIQSAHTLILPNLSRIRQLENYSIRANKVIFIENANDISIENLNSDIKCRDIKSSIKLGYVGVLSRDRSLDILAKIVAESDKFEFIVVGFGSLSSFFEEFSAPNVHYLGRLPHNEAMACVAECDALVALYDPTTPNHNFVSPNKLYESLQLGKPCLVFDGSAEAFSVPGLDNIVICDFPLTKLNDSAIRDVIIKFDKKRSLDYYTENFSETIQRERYIHALNEASC